MPRRSARPRGDRTCSSSAAIFSISAGRRCRAWKPRSKRPSAGSNGSPLSSPQCKIHYLLGNHDYCQEFLDYLDEHAHRIPNFAWHHFYLRLGANVFLHGDVVEKRSMTHERLLAYRSHWLHQPLAGKISRGAYDIVHNVRLHKPWAYLLHTKRRVARKILKYLDLAGAGPETGVRQVYFGHIHRRMFNYHYRGVTFHNCGAPIKGLRFRILEGSYDGSQPIHDGHREQATVGQ